MEVPMWRQARPADGEAIISMCLALHGEDPGIATVRPAQVRETLAFLEREPSRGRTLVAEADGHIAGYAFLVRFWSNELGGEVCEVDELFVRAGQRGNGLGSSLFEAIDAGRFGSFVAIALGVSPANGRARRLYERLGFRAAGTTMVRRGAGREPC
ncbi:MAG: GNAT family N-acetyltransferase [Anaeromyxobacter sp.]